MWTPNSAPILVLGSLALFTAAVQAILFALGMRSFILGRDYVWECSWQFPGRVVAALSRVRHWQPHVHNLGALAATFQGKAVSGGQALRRRARPLSRTMIRPLNLPNLQALAGPTAGNRRPVSSQHYQTVGERMRARQRMAA